MKLYRGVSTKELNSIKKKGIPPGRNFINLKKDANYYARSYGGKVISVDIPKKCLAKPSESDNAFKILKMPQRYFSNKCLIKPSKIKIEDEKKA